jgi:inosine/xanthosine triphosphatase
VITIAVASFNPVKLGAVRTAFSAQFPGVELDIIPVSVDSGVDDQPMSDQETRKGARNRVLAARRKFPDVEYCVGLEGGLDVYDGQLMASAWMAIGNRDGKISEARTPTLPLPPVVHELVAGGMELGEANDRVFAQVNSKQAGGAFGLLTAGLYTRESVYAQAVTLALIPFVNDLWS